jgi:cell division protein FtsB
VHKGTSKRKKVMNMMKTGMRIAASMGIITLVLAAGCEKQEKADIKMTRLIAAENEQLTAENEKLKSQVEQLKQELAKSEEERQKWKDKAEREIKENVEGIMKLQLEQNIKLTKEIEQLQAEIARLKGETATEPQAIPEEPNEGAGEEEKPEEAPAIPQ